MVTVWLNARTRIERVPSPVWHAHVGGKRVIKKWLSYRTRSVLGRDLTIPEGRHLSRMTRSVAALLMLTPSLDDNYTLIVAEQSE